MDKKIKDDGLREFTDYYVKNYPGPTTISNPEWHAPKLFRRAIRVIEAERDCLLNVNEEMLQLLRLMQRIGGQGQDMHKRIEAILARRDIESDAVAA